MSFIRHKKSKNGKEYAYEVTSVWDSEKKYSRSSSKYLGVVKDDGEVIPSGSSPRGRKPKAQELQSIKENLILDFGDGFIVSESIKKSSIYKPLEDIFMNRPELMTLMTYRLCQSGPMYNCSLWTQGSILATTTKELAISSQAISKLLSYLGNESVQRSFFQSYLATESVDGKNVIIDATSLPNQINSEFNAWGYSDGGIEEQLRLHCVVDQTTKRPLYYRHVPGNLADVSSLQVTMQELKALGVKQSFALVDSRLFSAENISLLRNANIDFLTRLPAGRKIYKEMIDSFAKDLETLANSFTYGKRGLFVKLKEVEDLYGAKGYLYMILDPQRKAKEIAKLLQSRHENPKERVEKQDEFDLKQAGIFMLISSKKIAKVDVLEAYYIRGAVEQIFGFAKSDLALLPIRCHSDATVRGYLFLQFLLLIVFIEIREKLLNDFTVEQAIMIMKLSLIHI